MAKKDDYKKILVVDDEENILWSLKKYLVGKDIKARIITAASGEEALEKLAKERIDLVISDIKMPGISGLDLLVEIKNHYPYISVIIMTAFPSSEYKRETLLKGGLHFIEKPFDIKLLREKVADIFKESTQFKGVLSGISLGDVIQIKCMSGVTAAMRVTEGKKQGIIFFDSGEIIHAICEDEEGEEALYQILSFAGGNLDTMKIVEMPERTIFHPYTALLMEGARRMDEQGGEPSESGEENVGRDAEAETSEESVEENIQDSSAGQCDGVLSGFRDLKGFRAAAIISPDSKMVCKEVGDGRVDLDSIGTTLNGFYRNSQKSVNQTPLGLCNELIVETPDEVFIMGCNCGENGSGNLFIAIFESHGSYVLGQNRMRKLLPDL